MAGKIRVTLDEQLLSDSQRKSVNSAAESLCEQMRTRSRERGESIIGRVWPGLESFSRDFRNIEPLLRLWPLNRVGTEPGKSGASVLAGRLQSNKSGLLPSRQMIVKVSAGPEIDREQAAKTRKELTEEWGAMKRLGGVFKDRNCFARPLSLHDPGDPNPVVLWAPFESPDDGYVLKDVGHPWKPTSVLEMVKYLGVAWSSTDYQQNQNARRQKLHYIITAADFLKNAHSVRGDRFRERVNPVKHYEEELRGFLYPMEPRGRWAQRWHTLWGERRMTRDFGKPWPSPMMVCRRLSESSTLSLRMGYVHGDLHPRNIVFAGEDAVRVIDFGWARPRTRKDSLQHIVKDFVLLEANLRFMTLPPSLPYESVTKFLDWIGCERTPREGIDDECRLRMDLISELRELAKRHVGQYRNWDIEYIVPLFLVSLGLLKHCHSADCTWAARYSVLAMAKYLNRRL